VSYLTLAERAVQRPTPETARHALDLALPWPPSLNRIWRAINSRILLSKEARAFKKAAAGALPVGRVPAPLTGRLAVHILLCPPANQQDAKWDIANREKLLCDALTQQRVWVDDSQIDWLSIARGPAFASGRAFVRIDVYHTDVLATQTLSKDSP
jgi:crossover junction endodeoxyribonuclease RusA